MTQQQQLSDTEVVLQLVDRAADQIGKLTSHMAMLQELITHLQSDVLALQLEVSALKIKGGSK